MTQATSRCRGRTTSSARWFAGCSSIVVAFGCASAPTASDAVETASRGDALEVGQFVIGTEPPAALQYNTGSYLSSASGDSTELVVFYDGGSIRGMRYDTVGERLDLDDWIGLGREPGGTEAYTDLAFGGGVYLVVYADHGVDAGVYANALDESGAMLGEPTLVHANAGYAAVVFNGIDFTVATYDGDIHLARIGLDGVPVANSSVPVTDSAVNNRPVLAMGPNGIGLVVFEQARDGGERKVYAARFDTNGGVLDPGGKLISDVTTSSVDVAVAAGAEGFLAVWSGGGSQVYGSLLDFDGNLLQAEMPISRSTAAVGGSSAAFDGSNYAVVWGDTSDGMIYGTRVSETGALLDAEDVQLAGPSRAFQSWDVELIWTGQSFSLSYAGDGVYGGFFDSTLVPLGPERIELSAVPSPQGPAVAAWDGANYVLAYSDERARDDLNYNFHSVRIGIDGTIEDPLGVVISEVDKPTGSGLVASNGEVTLYGWQPMFGDEVYRRVRDRDGSLSAPVLLDTGVRLNGLASNGDGFVATFGSGGEGGANETEVLGQSFDRAGEPTGEPFDVATITRPRGGLTSFAGDYLYFYSGQELDGAPITGSALRFDASGTVTADYGPVAEGMLTATCGASDEWILFSWQDGVGALWGRLLHVTDGFGEPFPLVNGAQEGPPGIAWDGTQFVVAYADQRQAMWTLGVSTQGVVTTPERSFDGDYGYVSLTAGPQGQMLLTYLRWGESSRTRRVESRLIGEGASLVPPVDETPEPEPVTTPVDDAATPSEPDETSTPEDPGLPVAVEVDDDTAVEESTADGEAAEDDSASGVDGATMVGTEADVAEEEAPITGDEAPEETALESIDGGQTSEDGSCSVVGTRTTGGLSLGSIGLVALALLRSRRRRSPSADALCSSELPTA